jgi:hypothetical protein
MDWDLIEDSYWLINWCPEQRPLMGEKDNEDQLSEMPVRESG